MKRLEEVLIRLDADLRKLRCRWALVGGLAVSIRARPRTTQDVDVAIAVTSDQEAERLVATLRGFGYDIFAILEQKATGRMATVRLLPPRELRYPLPESADEQTLTDLLFASSGIEPEVVADAELMTIFPGLRVPCYHGSPARPQGPVAAGQSAPGPDGRHGPRRAFAS